VIATLDAWRNRGRIVSWRSRDIFIIDSAESEPDATTKPPLLLVHGFPTSSWDFSPLWQALSGVFRVLGVDLLGLGFSGKPWPHRYRIAEQADLVEFVLQHAGIGQCHILAHDYGDTVTQELLARDVSRPQARFLSAVLLNGGLFPETHYARPMQKLMAGPLGPLLARFTTRNRLLDTFRAVFGARSQPDSETLEAVWQLVNYNDGLRVLPPLLHYIAERRQHRERWVNALRGARAPLALINGSDDPVSGAHMVARFREVVGTQHFIHELPGIGHYPQLEAPGQVLAACRQFWQEVGAVQG
jgi:pimeloyl-ACP methyl ester carboxylesterase